jgi:hypothetical protein
LYVSPLLLLRPLKLCLAPLNRIAFSTTIGVLVMMKICKEDKLRIDSQTFACLLWAACALVGCSKLFVCVCDWALHLCCTCTLHFDISFINLKSCEHVIYSGSYGFIIVIFKIGLVVCDLDKCLDNNSLCHETQTRHLVISFYFLSIKVQ